MNRPMRSIGRRRTDRFKIVVGLFLGLVLASVALLTSRCGGGTVTGPDPVDQVPAPPVAQAPQPAASPTPQPAVGEEGAVTATFKNGPSFTIDNSMSIPKTVGYCNFRVYTGGEQQLHESGLDLLINAGGQLAPSISKLKCQQVDAIWGGSTCQNFTGVIGAAYYKDGIKVTSHDLVDCNDQCVPTWRELEEVRVITDWAEYTPEETASAQVCYKYERRLVIHREQNSCDKSTRDKGEQFYEYRQTQIECPCVNVPTTREVVTTTYSEWGACSIETGKRTRTKTVTTTIYTTNSCTKQETAGEPTIVVTNEEQACTCQDYQPVPPTITGNILLSTTSDKWTVSAGTVAPSGGTFVPSLPKTGDLGAAFTFSTTYTVSGLYGPPSLECSATASKEFSVDVPAGICYYNVDDSHDFDGQASCFAQPGFISWNDANHLCALTFPGVDIKQFHLNGGQSAKGCIK